MGLLVVNIPLLMALNIGTAAMLMLAFATVIIRSRHFSDHGKEALLVLTMFVIGAAFLRWMSTNHPEILPTDWQRVSNGILALGCAGTQWLIVAEAELEIRARRLYRQ